MKKNGCYYLVKSILKLEDENCYFVPFINHLNKVLVSLISKRNKNINESGLRTLLVNTEYINQEKLSSSINDNKKKCLCIGVDFDSVYKISKDIIKSEYENLKNVIAYKFSTNKNGKICFGPNLIDLGFPKCVYDKNDNSTIFSNGNINKNEEMFIEVANDIGDIAMFLGGERESILTLDKYSFTLQIKDKNTGYRNFIFDGDGNKITFSEFSEMQEKEFDFKSLKWTGRKFFFYPTYNVAKEIRAIGTCFMSINKIGSGVCAILDEKIGTRFLNIFKNETMNRTEVISIPDHSICLKTLRNFNEFASYSAIREKDKDIFRFFYGQKNDKYQYNLDIIINDICVVFKLFELGNSKTRLINEVSFKYNKNIKFIKEDDSDENNDDNDEYEFIEPPENEEQGYTENDDDNDEYEFIEPPENEERGYTENDDDNYDYRFKESPEDEEQDYIENDDEEMESLGKELAERFEKFNKDSDARRIDALRSFFNTLNKKEKIAYLLNCGYIRKFVSREDSTEDKFINKEIFNSMINKLTQKNKENSLLILGEPGVGKTYYTKHLTKLILNNKIKGLKDKVVYELVPSKFKLDLIGSLENDICLISSCCKDNKNIILVCDNFCSMFKLGAYKDNPYSNVGVLLNKEIEGGDMQIIAISTASEFSNIDKEFPSINKFGDPIYIPNMSSTLLKEFTDEKISEIETKLRTTIKEKGHFLFLLGVIKNKYYPNLAEPGATSTILKDYYKYLEQSSLNNKSFTIDEMNLINYFKKKNNINCSLSTLKVFEKEIKHSIKGQDNAIEDVIKLIKTHNCNFETSLKPCSAIFAGFPGVGKTETAKLIAEHYFNNSKALIKIDVGSLGMYAKEKIISSNFALIKGLKENSGSVILFDEIEKGSSELTDVLLGALNDGFIQDENGLKISLSNCIFIFTTNLGSKKTQNTISFTNDIKINEDEKNNFMKAIENHFRPEFLSRISSTITFERLSKKCIVEIAEQEIKKAKERNYKFRNITITKQEIEESIDKIPIEKEGARSVQKYVENLLTEKAITENEKNY